MYGFAVLFTVFAADRSPITDHEHRPLRVVLCPRWVVPGLNHQAHREHLRRDRRQGGARTDPDGPGVRVNGEEPGGGGGGVLDLVADAAKCAGVVVEGLKKKC